MKKVFTATQETCWRNTIVSVLPATFNYVVLRFLIMFRCIDNMTQSHSIDVESLPSYTSIYIGRRRSTGHSTWLPCPSSSRLTPGRNSEYLSRPLTSSYLVRCYNLDLVIVRRQPVRVLLTNLQDIMHRMQSVPRGATVFFDFWTFNYNKVIFSSSKIWLILHQSYMSFRWLQILLFSYFSALLPWWLMKCWTTTSRPDQRWVQHEHTEPFAQ